MCSILAPHSGSLGQNLGISWRLVRNAECQGAHTKSESAFKLGDVRSLPQSSVLDHNFNTRGSYPGFTECGGLVNLGRETVHLDFPYQNLAFILI